MKPIIDVQNVSKIYSRNSSSHLDYGMRDLIAALTMRSVERELRRDEFFAVDNISFHVNRGDSIALIGRNGSGKTTLLKLMTGLTPLDKGTIIMDGRLQALINLGAGFHPDLTGRQNIYNSASLMGLTRRETQSIVDDVVDFSELEEFIDSPFSTYSSGMKARLGFAVAISLKPEILLVDEILSVGDYAFQNKCFIRMHELKKRGVTIVLVSHSHTSVIQMCDKALWIHKGKLQKQGAAKDVVRDYLAYLDAQEADRTSKLNALREESNQAIKLKAKDSDQNDSLYGPIYDEYDRIEDLQVQLFSNGRATDSIAVHDELEIDCRFRLKQEVSDLNVSICFFRKDGLKISTISTLNGDLLKHVRKGEVHFSLRIPDLPLNPGSYVIVMPIHEGKSYLYRNIVKEVSVRQNHRMTWDLVDLNYVFVEERADGQSINSPYL